MKILIAPDKFKGSLTAAEVCQSVHVAFRTSRPDIEVHSIPLADGGEGTCKMLTELTGGQFIPTLVFDPLLREIKSEFGISADGKTAFVEMAMASGLELLSTGEQNCMETSTIGTGQLIRAALDRGVNKIILGIGGSATNDAGMGMAEALGFKLLSAEGNFIQGIGKNLIHLHRIDSTSADDRISKTEFVVLCDVDNPLYGKEGAAFVFAKQKGASPAEIELLDKGLENFSKVGANQNKDVNFPGAGAAGGLGAGAYFFLNARLEKGTDFIFRFTDLESKVREADLIITGEGKIDKQTLSGKVVKGVADLARKYKKKLVAIAGDCELNDAQLSDLGIAQVFTLTDDKTPKEVAIKNAGLLLRDRINQIIGELK